jgi:cyclopropane-fatty-acyl-phospholipid synthase
MDGGAFPPDRSPGLFVPDGSVAARPAGLTAIARWLAQRLQRVLDPVAVRVELWDGWSPWRQAAAPVGSLLVRDPMTLPRLLTNPELHFGDAYMFERVEVRGDLAAVVQALSRITRPGPLSLRGWLALHLSPPNGLTTSRRNVHHHYDLGNDFYALWLDPQLVYTCAYFPDPEVPLQAAQVAKLDLVCRKLQLRPGDTVVEAGCGWGALALHMARHYGARVKAFNISRAQLRYARGRAAREGLTDRVEFIEDDYRNVTGTFDAFVSIGMVEHVGRAQYRSLATTIARTLKRPDGRGLLHFIGRDRPRPLNAWIRRRIFPGAYPPTLKEVHDRVLEPADLSIVDVENLRVHYAHTLLHWRGRYEQAEREVRAAFGDEFWRAWHLYLAGAEAAFLAGWLQLFQVVFAPACGTSIYWSRADVYRTPAPAPRGS